MEFPRENYSLFKKQLKCLQNLSQVSYFYTTYPNTYLVIFWLLIFASFSSLSQETLKSRDSDYHVIFPVLVQRCSKILNYCI